MRRSTHSWLAGALRRLVPGGSRRVDEAGHGSAEPATQTDGSELAPYRASSEVADIDQRAHESDLFKRAYAEYRAEFDSKSFALSLAPYPTLGAKGEGMHHAFINLMLRDHTSQLANELNAAVIHYHQLASWSNILPQYGTDDRIILVREFIDCVGVYLLNFPYSIAQRFAYSVSHISHQANLLTRPNVSEHELPPDDRINPMVMRRIANNWPSFGRFEHAFSRINDESFEKATDEFRRRQHHRMPSRLEIGFTQMVVRTRKENAVSYGIGGRPPLMIGELLHPIAREHAQARATFDAYIDLVKEQCEAIEARQDAGPSRTLDRNG